LIARKNRNGAKITPKKAIKVQPKCLKPAVKKAIMPIAKKTQTKVGIHKKDVIMKETVKPTSTKYPAKLEKDQKKVPLPAPKAIIKKTDTVMHDESKKSNS